MQALPVSPKSIDLGQLFVGGAASMRNQSGRQVGAGATKTEGELGSFFAALTLGNGDGESAGWATEDDGPSLGASAEQRTAEQGTTEQGTTDQGSGAEGRDPDVEGAAGGAGVVVVSAETLGDSAEKAVVYQTAVARWLSAEIAAGSPELPAVVDEAEQVVAEEGPAKRVGHQVKETSGRGDVARLLVRKADNRPAFLQEPPSRQANVEFVREVAYRGADFVGVGPRTAAAVETPVARVATRPFTAPDLTVPKELIADTPAAELPPAEAARGEASLQKNASVGDVPDTPRAAARELAVVEVDPSRADLNGRPFVLTRSLRTAERAVEVGAAVEHEAPRPADVDGETTPARVGERPETPSAAHRETPPARAFEVPRGDTPPEGAGTRVVVAAGQESVRAAASPAADTEPRNGQDEDPTQTFAVRQARSETSEDGETTPRDARAWRSGPQRHSQDRVRGADVTNDRPLASAAKAAPAESAHHDGKGAESGLPVDNRVDASPEPANRSHENPQPEKAVENSIATDADRTVDGPRQRAEAMASVAPSTTGDSALPAYRELEPFQLARPEIDANAEKAATNRGSEVRGQQVHPVRKQSDDGSPQRSQPGMRQPEGDSAGATAAPKASAATRTQPPDLEAYRLTLAASRTQSVDMPEVLKPFGNQGLASSFVSPTSNPQAVDKRRGTRATDGAERRWEPNQVPRGDIDWDGQPPVDRSRNAPLVGMKQLLGPNPESPAETDARSAKATHTAASAIRESTHQQTPTLGLSDPNPESASQAAQPVKPVSSPVSPSNEAGPQPARQGILQLPKADQRPVEPLAGTAAAGPKPLVTAMPGSGSVIDKVPADTQPDRALPVPDAARNTSVETAFLDRRTDQNALQVQVKDDRLGRVVVRLTERAGLIRAMVRTDGAQSRDLLNQQLPALMESLLRRGFETRQDGLAEQSPEGRDGPHSREEQRRQRHPQRQRREGRAAKPAFQIRLN